MSKIVSIGTAVPRFKHEQTDILGFMQQVYALDQAAARKMRFLYHQSGIDTRYSVIPDYSTPASEWTFYPASENLEPFPGLDQRMACWQKHAATLSLDAIRDCLKTVHQSATISHLITVSCTGMSAPGLDLQLMELLDLPRDTQRSSINFMGCYAAIHALKTADLIVKADSEARVLIVCTELCTLHFQREATSDNIASSLLFADGAAAALICGDQSKEKGWRLDGFYSEVVPKGKQDMSWEISSRGFLMTLSGYVPDLIEEDFNPLLKRSLTKIGVDRESITDWCIHPGGRRILDVIAQTAKLEPQSLQPSYQVLKEYGNMSSPTILFVLKKIMQNTTKHGQRKAFAAAFGPGLTMETFVTSTEF